MSQSNYFMTTDEMVKISKACKHLDETRIWLTEQFPEVNVFQDDQGFDRSFMVSDSNGELLGFIGMGEDGKYAFYFANEYVDE